MLRIVGARLLNVVAVLVLVSASTFFLLELLPGSPAQSILGTDATPEQIDLLNQRLGLDRPVVVRYLDWVGSAVTGDLGESLQTRGVDVIDVIQDRFVVTLELALVAQAMALLLAVPAALLVAYKAGRLVDHAISSIVFALVSFPSFVLAIAFVYVLAIRAEWFPVTGWVRLTENPSTVTPLWPITVMPRAPESSTRTLVASPPE